MLIKISGHNIDHSGELAKSDQRKSKLIIKKFFKNSVRADIIFTKNNHLIFTSIKINNGLGKHQNISSIAKAEDPYVSFNLSIEKLEKQLRRKKNKVKAHKDKYIADIKRKIS